MRFLYTIILCVMFEFPVQGGSPENTVRTIALCPKLYIDDLALCPSELACEVDGNCSSNYICCMNACGTKTCVAPWIHEVETEDQSACDNVTCRGRGKRCRVVNGEAQCTCQRFCPLVTSNDDLTCDQNGVMYPSVCLLEKTACASDLRLVPTRCIPIQQNPAKPGMRFPPIFSHAPPMRIVNEGETVTFSCEPKGNPPPTIYWQLNDGILLSSTSREERKRVNEVGTLTIPRVTTSDSGIYSCVATNKYGQAASGYRLEVRVTKNNFRSGRSPKTTIVCNSMPMEQARKCIPGQDQQIQKMWVYYRNKNVCRRMYFRDCYAITNKFESKHECEKACSRNICALPPVTGPCHDFSVRIAYDTSTGACKPFYYGGCGGNLNNFENLESCYAICGEGSHTGLVPSPVCPRCEQKEAQAVCASNFAVVAIVKHFQPRSLNHRNGQAFYMRVQITHVIMDKSGILNLRRRNLRNVDDARMDIKVVLDENCPCPDIRSLNPTNSDSTSRHRKVGRSGEVKAIIVGTTINGFPTLNSTGLAQEYSEVGFSRVRNSAIKDSSLCALIELLDLQGR